MIIAAAILAAAPVVVELFTSQGCSSCPPADALISELQRDRNVIPLAFHVDYWDHLGWKDAFSSRMWTQRQMMYVHQMHLNSAYTPQAVVNGSVQFVGSSRGAMMNAIADASRKSPVGSISLTAQRDDSVAIADVKADVPPEYDLVLVLVQNHAITDVEGGENSGRRAIDAAIARRIVRASNGRTQWKVDPQWHDLAVVAFLQNRETLTIGNAAIAPVILSAVKDRKIH